MRLSHAKESTFMFCGVRALWLYSGCGSLSRHRPWVEAESINIWGAQRLELYCTALTRIIMAACVSASTDSIFILGFGAAFAVKLLFGGHG